MGLLTYLKEQFDYPLPGLVLLVGFGLWILASLWSIVGGVLSQLTSLAFAFVALLAALIGALGTLLIVVGGLWYGILLVVDFREELRTENSN